MEIKHETTVEAKEAEHENCGKYKYKKKCGHGTGGAIYGLGFVGALIYFIQHGTTFLAGALGVLKAIVWPAMLVYKALELLKF